MQNRCRCGSPVRYRVCQVACVECHAPGVAREADIFVSQLRFTGLAYEECTDCHVDAHAGRLGAGCPTCHTTVSWKEVASSDVGQQQSETEEGEDE